MQISRDDPFYTDVLSFLCDDPQLKFHYSLPASSWSHDMQTANHVHVIIGCQ